MKTCKNLLTKIFPYVLLLMMTAIALYFTRPVSLQIRWNDETLYYTVAQNIVRHFDFNSNHYLASSIIQKGYPTKDTHLPGYPLILAVGFLIGGINERTPFFVNYFLLILTIFLIFTVGRFIANQWVGFGASLIYLIYPYTLILTHSVMTEISAAAVIMVVVALLFVQKESFLKGIFLGLVIALAYLIKPFLLTLFPASIAVLWIEKNQHYKKTFLSLLFSFGLLFVTVLIPLSQNQEIYPYAATIILSQSNLTDMLRMIWENFLFNCTLIINFKKFSVYGTITISMLVLWSINLAVLATASYQKKLQRWQKYTNLSIFSLINFLSALLAFLLLYQYINATRGLAVFSPLMAILSVTGLWLLTPQLKIKKVVAIGLGICLYLSYSNFVTFHLLRKTQQRQYQRLSTNSSRLEKVISKLPIQPQVVMSEKNLYLAIANYPTQVIWQLPQTLHELREVEKKVRVELIELKDSDPIFQENLQVYQNLNLLNNRYILQYQDQNFYYYLRLDK
ncbi:MAG: glycosyltransferase family 39 protein [Okeania sp. SIO2G4]|uniref:ArnT family glycosyltransferase n=1 Tax=unclassified Okeania TaxID=2634635 RepID=UPI0013BE4B79|nr:MULTISPECIES: glycosyltransferase family 39 protein [unclassified Okeania]NEP38583.1 glycosyltransferase family 39 protein [Okeania sp. SIO2H7]NEP73159.1 glycosyltransferase family 39 protein [Okeania sp. SIO2G5]NEP94022.1 glycosyltransferase family 39 protein [Okeania sp. SIO2F5]NEQ91854.1 glycosyltransferase family 39 protein [Okeania sp. SIO2G4]